MHNIGKLFLTTYIYIYIYLSIYLFFFCIFTSRTHPLDKFIGYEIINMIETQSYLIFSATASGCY